MFISFLNQFHMCPNENSMRFLLTQSYLYPKNYVYSIYDSIRLHIPYNNSPALGKTSRNVKKSGAFRYTAFVSMWILLLLSFFVIHLFRLLISLLICIIINSAIENRFSILFDTVLLHYIFMHGYWLVCFLYIFLVFSRKILLFVALINLIFSVCNSSLFVGIQVRKST